MMHGFGGGGFGMGFGWIFMVVFWGAIIYLVYSLLKRSNDGCGKTDSALDILHRRYASGEISKEEFERVKKDLQI